MALSLVSLSLGWLVALLATPVVRGLAFRLGCIDLPDGGRKLHRQATPLLGGLAIVLGFFAAVGVLLAAPASWSNGHETRFLLGLLAAGTVVCIVGVCDDLWELRPSRKFSGQLLAAVVLVAFGLAVRHITVLGVTVDLGLFGVPFTVLWLLGAMNAVNFLDGLDGLATGVGAIAATLFSIVALASGKLVDAAAAAALAGAALGFLRYNFPPARIFLGDTGSLFIGLLLGAISIHGSMKTPATLLFAVPVGLLAVPLLDGAVAILRRRLVGKAVQTADRGHIHHCLVDRGFSPLAAVFCLWGLSLVTGAAALAGFYWQNDFIALAATFGVVVLLVASKSFAHYELRLLISRVGALLTAARRAVRRALAPSPSRRAAEPPLYTAPGAFPPASGPLAQERHHAEVA